MNLDKDYLFELIVRCVDKIYYDEEIFESSNYTHKEISEFLENLGVNVFEKIQQFLLSAPKLNYVIKYKNSLDHEREIVLSSLNDFFTWR